MSSFYGFTKHLPPLETDIRPLPEEGKSKDFFGAVGFSFSVKAKLEPEKVHPGDLISASYEVKFDGYFPSNAIPVISGLSENDFTVYPVKLQSSGEDVIKWTQVLVPKSAAATNSFAVTIPYYDLKRKVYDSVSAKVKALEFVSEQAASTKNTSVIVSDVKEDDVSSVQSNKVDMLELRFAPNDNSPVIARIPSTAKITELGRYGKWIRLSSSEAIGWIKR
jgi:hypothetical protein